MRRAAPWIAALGLVLVACSGPASEPAPSIAPSSAPVPGGTAYLGTHHEPTTLLDWNAQTTFDMLIADLMFHRLARPGPQHGTFVPDLAESWEELPDGRSVRFRLRGDLTWEDGTPVGVDDVLFSHERARNSGAIGDRKRRIASVERAGERDVIFRFDRHYRGMLDDAVLGHVYPAHVLGAVAEAQLAGHPFNRQAALGSGPFRLEAWQAQQYIAFKRRDDTPSAALLERVVVSIFKDKQATYRELQAGGLDYLRKVKQEQYDLLVGGSGLRGLRSASREYFYLVWNTRRPEWSRPEARRAMTALVDRDAIARRYEGQGATVAEGPVPPEDKRFDPQLDSPFYAPDAVSPPPVGRPLVLLGLAGDALHAGILEAVAAYLRRAGFEPEPRLFDTAELDRRVREGAFDAALFVRPKSEPVNLLECFGTSGTANRAGLSDPELDRLLAGGEQDTFDRAYRRVVELQPWTFLHYRSDSVVFSPRLRGLEANARDPIAVIERWWIPAELQ